MSPPTIQTAPADKERARQFRDAALPYLDAAHSYALLLTRNDADAQDAVQDCYLLAMRHFSGFRGGSMKAWLFSILRNVCLSDIRRPARREQAADLSAQEDFVGGAMWQEPEETPEVILQRRQEGETVRRLVNALPAPFREAVVLREFLEMSYQEIADVSHAPVGTVMSRLARGRSMLCTAWETTQRDGRRPPARMPALERCA